MIPSRGDYLFTEVMTATPQKLQLMLIEAALRSAGQARQHWADAREEAACQALIRSQNILAEMLAALDPKSEDPFHLRILGTYMFVYRSLIAANLEHSAERLDAAVRVLEIERQTWRLVCNNLDSHDEAEMAVGGASFEA